MLTWTPRKQSFFKSTEMSIRILTSKEAQRVTTVRRRKMTQEVEAREYSVRNND